ncbi:MAG: DUF2442 domain-containing protein [Bacteriovorax sp.]|nr:DUF2442 domain-containing protein [Bacteriovorax sp.]
MLKITSVKYLRNYLIKISFVDGEKRTVDFLQYLNSSTNPEIRNYLCLENFKSFKIQNGDLTWGDFDLLFPIQDLYAGKVSAYILV